MDTIEALGNIAEKVKTQKNGIETEEATKNAFVMPFISLVLGYDVFDPNEVVPEFTADIGTKKGEKIDYAIVHDGEVQILIECKKVCEPICADHASQLFRYFAVTNARIAILTNGEEYQFYSDLEKPNRMDDKPFLILNMSDIDESVVPELKKLTKQDFDLSSILSAAEELKYIGEIKRVLASQFKSPDDEWVRFLATRVYEGIYKQKVKEQFGVLVPKAMKQFLTDQVNDRLKAAMARQAFESPVEEVQNDANDDKGGDEDNPEEKSGVNTTLDEIQGFQVVRAIACSEVPLERIAARDTKSYFGILLDDNNRKPIVRLHFNHATKYLGLFDPEKNETKFPLKDVDEIYQYADEIRKTIHYYD